MFTSGIFFFESSVAMLLRNKYFSLSQYSKPKALLTLLHCLSNIIYILFNISLINLLFIIIDRLILIEQWPYSEVSKQESNS